MNPPQKLLAVISTERDEFVDARILTRAVALARNNQASLTLAVVVNPNTGYSLLSKTSHTVRKLLENELIESRQELELKCEKLRAETGLNITSVILTGKMELEVVQQVVKQGFDLVLKSHEEPSGIGNALFGSADMNLMRKCPCPVLIVKPSEEQQFRVIVAALAHDEEAPENHLLNIRILELATWMAIAESSELHIIHAWTLPFELLLRSYRSGLSSKEVDALAEKEEEKRKRWLNQTLGEFDREHRSTIDHLSPLVHTMKGVAYQKIIEKTEEVKADLIVMGTVGRIGVPGLVMGNTSETILHQVNCAVMTMKPPGFANPLLFPQEKN